MKLAVSQQPAMTELMKLKTLHAIMTMTMKPYVIQNLIHILKCFGPCIRLEKYGYVCLSLHCLSLPLKTLIQLCSNHDTLLPSVVRETKLQLPVIHGNCALIRLQRLQGSWFTLSTAIIST